MINSKCSVVRKCIFRDGILADCSFLVGRADENQQMIYADSKVLIETSEEFERIIDTYGIDVEEPIEFQNIQPHIFRKLLKHFYGDEQPNLIGENWSDLVALKLAAEQFMIHDYEYLCIERFENDLKVENVWQGAYEASLQCEETRKICEKFLSINTRECLNHPTFLGISKSILVQFLSLDTLNIESELDLVTACIRLAEAKGEEKSYFMDVAIPHLRLLTLRVGNLNEIRNYLSPEEVRVVTDYQRSPVQPNKIPLRICPYTWERKKPKQIRGVNISLPQITDCEQSEHYIITLKA